MVLNKNVAKNIQLDEQTIKWAMNPRISDKWVYNNYDIIFNYFYYKNKFLGLKEGYIVVFVLNTCKFVSDDFLNIINTIERDFKKHNLDWINIEIFCEDPSYYDKINCIFDREQDAWDLVYTTIKKKINSQTISNSGYIMRRGTDNDKRIVHKCIYRAHLLGLPKKMKSLVSKRRLMEKVKKTYKNILDQDYLFIVCEKNEQLYGYSLIDLRYDIHERAAFLLDTFTLEQYRNQGIGRLLNSFCENECSKLGYQYLIGTVVDKFNKEILENLSLVGWDVRSKVYGKKVR